MWQTFAKMDAMHTKLSRIEFEINFSLFLHKYVTQLKSQNLPMFFDRSILAPKAVQKIDFIMNIPRGSKVAGHTVAMRAHFTT